MKNLYLVLKNPWFDMIKSGEKKEEYRELSEFYKRRFYDKSGNLKKFDTLEFVLGYPRKDDMSKRLFFSEPTITIRQGKPEWGAEAGKEYFVITWKHWKDDV